MANGRLKIGENSFDWNFHHLPAEDSIGLSDVGVGDEDVGDEDAGDEDVGDEGTGDKGTSRIWVWFKMNFQQYLP